MITITMMKTEIMMRMKITTMIMRKRKSNTMSMYGFLSEMHPYYAMQ